jgi:hypothetical protein
MLQGDEHDLLGGDSQTRNHFDSRYLLTTSPQELPNPEIENSELDSE